MILNYNTAMSSNKPDAIDDTSSSTVVYIRKNITETTTTDSETEESITMYTYEEAKVNKSDYELYKTEILKDIEISELNDQVTSLNDQISSLESVIEELIGDVIPSIIESTSSTGSDDSTSE